MRKWIPVLIIILLVAGGVWFWSLSGLPAVSEPVAALSDVVGTVSVKDPNGSDFILAKTGHVVSEGASIKTGTDSKATLDWFGAGESRLGANTELVVIRATDKRNGNIQLRLRLEAGRLWSRVSRLLDLDGDISVETEDVVATVRGTSFDLEKKPGQPTTLWVADSVVEAAGATVLAGQDGFFVPQGMMADFGGSDRTTSTRLLSDFDRQTDWFKNNRSADERFHHAVLERLEASVSADRLPSSGFFRDLVSGSEGLRLRFTSGEARQALAERYLLRRLIVIRRTVEEGKSGLASQEFARLDIQSTPGAAKSAQRIFYFVGPSDAAYRIKQQVEEWLPVTAKSEGERIFSRLYAVGVRLDEAAMALMFSDTNQAKQMLVLARQGLANIEREIRDTKGVDPITRVVLRHQWSALSARASALDDELERGNAPIEPVAPATPIEEVTPTSTEPATTTPAVPEPVIPTSTPPVVKPVPVSLRIEPSQSQIGFSESVSYRAVLVYDTGLTRDVTKGTRFQASPSGYGALNGNIFRSTELQGTLTISATYTEDGQTVQGSASLIIAK